MNDPQSRTCPHCGSNRLVARMDSRKVFINQAGQRIPLLTVNLASKQPVMEERNTTYSCTCSWTGNRDELEPTL